MSAAPIARLKVTLNDVELPVVRRIEVPLALRVDRLHIVLQEAFGWMGSHLYEFQAGRSLRWGEPTGWDFGDAPLDARKVTLDDVVAEAGRKRLEYVYDFGDNWTHTLKVEGRIAAEPGHTYPRLVEARGACPPEDVGGPFGYAEFLEAIAVREHERHDEQREWIGGDFDPSDVDAEAIARRLDALATAWARMPRTRTRKRA